MHLNYKQQLEVKTQRVSDALKRIGRLEHSPLNCIPSPSPLYYRNKIQLPFFQKNGKIALGLYQKHSKDIVKVNTCYIH